MMSSERRLHPLSLIFTFGKLFRQLIIPFVIALLASRSGGTRSSIFLIFVVLTGIEPILNYISFRYRYEDNDLVIRSGIFVRNERHIPYDRIQNIDAVQTLLHRILGVVTVLVQTGSGKSAEATLKVLPLSALEEMRMRVFAGGRAPAPDAQRAGNALREEDLERERTIPVARGETIVHVTPQELFLGGLIENRGLVLILGATAFVLAQLDDFQDDVAAFIRARLPALQTVYESAEQSFRENQVPVRGILLAIAGLALLAVIVRLIAACWTVVRLHDFRVTRDGDDLRIEHGLLTRVHNTVPLRRIQTLTVAETLLHRWLGRVAVRITTAGGHGEAGEASADRSLLAPILPRAALSALLERVQPGLDLTIPLNPPHPRGIRRELVVGMIFPAVVSALSFPWIGGWSMAIFIALATRAALRALLHIRNLGWGTTDNAIVFRGGVVRRITTAVRFSRMQVVAIEESPFDRRTHMATIVVDTAGGRGHTGMPFMPERDARELHEFLSRKTAETAFIW
jgi:putative membrane protein